MATVVSLGTLFLGAVSPSASLPFAAGPAAARPPTAKNTQRPAKPSPRAAASPRAVPGMGATLPCFSSVAYSVNGKTRPARPLPPVTSSAGGERLAAPGLQVTPSAKTPPPAPKATAWLVADLSTGRVLAACNAHVPLAPASSLKVLTALALTPRIAPATRYVARQEDAAVDGTRVGLVPGSAYTADDLWHALLMGSANDAATGLAAMAGGTASATTVMNDTARSLGANDTRAVNTSGLDEPGQVSSAYDLALFGRAALANPVITKYVQTRSYAFPEAGAAIGPPRKTFQIQNHDKLLYNYPGALGVKNGWTSTTGGSFVGAAERGGRRVIATVIAADPQTWQMSRALMDWAFSATAPGSEGVGELVTGPVDPAGPSRTAEGGAAEGAHAAAPGDPDGGIVRISTSSAEPKLTAGQFFALVAGGVALIAVGRHLLRRRH
ncbi:MAG: hypothetical protein QG622_2902 [Actinomycetota bacterium]|nr:hypothetical protein [Actinomycetota bacterium]